MESGSYGYLSWANTQYPPIHVQFSRMISFLQVSDYSSHIIISSVRVACPSILFPFTRYGEIHEKTFRANSLKFWTAKRRSNKEPTVR
jgi:hypothetical protein